MSRNRRRIVLLGTLFSLLVAACGDSAGTTTTIPGDTTTSEQTGTSEPTSTTQPAITTTEPTSSTTEPSVSDTNDLAEGSGCKPGGDVLPDGEWFGLVAARDDDSLEFDLVCLFIDAADRAAAEDGEESPALNNYHIRNVNPKTRQVPVTADVEVVFFPNGGPSNETTITYGEWADLVDQRGYENLVLLEIEDGVIVEILEQWFP